MITQPGQLGFTGDADGPGFFGGFAAEQTVLVVV
jgi:hypothetical protein